MAFRDKILAGESLVAWRFMQRRCNRRVVVTNGCFDILHLGHISYLEAARGLGDVLLVGLNSDDSVRALKGPSRPVQPQDDRVAVVAALACVDAVCVFEEQTAEAFLIRAAPDVWVKGGDYTVDTVNQPERSIVETAGGRVVILPMIAGRSTTDILRRLNG